MFRVSARAVLELGSELISTDIIAFYELIKNGFDANSPTGVEIHFRVALRRNAYIQLRARAVEALGSNVPTPADGTLERLRADLARALNIPAGPDSLGAFAAACDAKDLASFIELLDHAYHSTNAIEISDTGEGMSLDSLKENYLVIGTTSRKRAIEAAVSAGLARAPFLGEKGIGRLSAMRLGERLRVESARATDSTMNVLEIDWRLFGDLDAMVEDISIDPRSGGSKPDRNWSGTRLTVSALSEDWTEERVRTMAGYEFARLTDPFLDPKARPRIALFWNGSRVAIPWMDRELLAHAHASVVGTYSLSDSGEPTLRCKLEAKDLGFPHPPETDAVTLSLPDLEGAVVGTSHAVPVSALTSLGPFEFEAHWYNRRRLARIESIGDHKEVRDLQRKWSGILLFRDGFRVFPYGEDEDDWLALDRKALGRPSYGLNKAQFLGRVTIARTRNPRLIDQTNREGLRATPEQQVLVRLLQHVIQDLLWDFMRDLEKRYKQQPLDLEDVRDQVDRLENRAKVALGRIRGAVEKEHRDVVDDLQQLFLEFQDLADRAQRRVTEVEDDSRQMIQMAGVGLLVEVVAHELARSSENALQALETLRGKEMPAEVQARLDTLRAEMKSVSKRLRVLDPLSVSGRQRSEAFDLAQLLEDLREGHAAQFRRHNMIFHVERPGGPLRIRAVKGMVVQILENLISNSVYWMQLRATRESEYEPRITVTLLRDPVTIRFRDNGRGIAPEHREKVFRPFWSLKEKSKRRGLGLFIARECASYLGGRLYLSDATDADSGRLNEFVLELPDSVSMP